MLKTLALTGIGLILTGSLSAKEIASEKLDASVEQLSADVAHEAPGALSIPAWREPGFVMDEVIATAEPAPIDVPETTPISPDLEDLLDLHEAVRSLNF